MEIVALLLAVWIVVIPVSVVALTLMAPGIAERRDRWRAARGEARSVVVDLPVRTRLGDGRHANRVRRSRSS